MFGIVVQAIYCIGLKLVAYVPKVCCGSHVTLFWAKSD